MVRKRQTFPHVLGDERLRFLRDVEDVRTGQRDAGLQRQLLAEEPVQEHETRIETWFKILNKLFVLALGCFHLILTIAYLPQHISLN